jgi:hypothetical protein
MASAAQIAAWRRQLDREQVRLVATQRRIAQLRGRIADADKRQRGRG